MFTRSGNFIGAFAGHSLFEGVQSVSIKWPGAGPVYTGGAAGNTVAKPLYRAQMLANNCIKDMPPFSTI